MHVLVRIRMLEGESARGKGGKLRADFARELAANGGTEEVAEAEAELIGGKPALPVHEIRDFLPRQDGGTFDHDKMEPDAKAGQVPGTGDGVCGGGRGHHQACGAEDAFPVRPLNGFVDRRGKAEIVG